MKSQLDILISNFYKWEQPLRGIRFFDYPVNIEPPFVPFIHDWKAVQNPIDDTRIPTVFENIASFTKRVLSTNQRNGAAKPEPKADSNVQLDLTLLRVSLPRDPKISITEQLLQMLCLAGELFSFEVILHHHKIELQFGCRKECYHLFCTYLKSYFPESTIEVNQDDPLKSFDTSDKYFSTTELALAQEFMRPITTTSTYNIDYFIQLLALLKNMKPDESAVLQVLFKGSQKPWAESIIRSVTDATGKNCFFTDYDMLTLAKQKVSSSLVACVIRTIGFAGTQSKAHHLNSEIKNIIIQFSNSNSNSLTPLTKDQSIQEQVKSDIIGRTSHRTGMLLNTSELLTFIHFPSLAVINELNKNLRKTKAAPAFTRNNPFIIGINEHHNKIINVSIDESVKTRHGLCLGASGSGKSFFA